MRVCTLLLALVMLALVAIPTGQVRTVHATPKLPSGLQDSINAAIEKGVEWLRGKQERDGSWKPGENQSYGGGENDGEGMRYGLTALCTLALLESDVPTNSDNIQKAITWLMANTDRSQLSYDNGTFLMAMHSYYRCQLKEKISKKSPKQQARILANARYKIDPKHAVALKVSIKEITDLQMKNGGWRYNLTATFEDADKSDISSTQFALLGLHAATQLGQKVEMGIFARAMQYCMKSQEQDGPGMPEELRIGSPTKSDSSYIPTEEDRARGWSYCYNAVAKERDRKVNGGMTTVGICSLIICKAQLAKHSAYAKVKKQLNQAIFDGFGWLTYHWSVESNPEGDRSYYYYLYGLERSGVLGGFDYIGPYNWYREGAERLVAEQDETGFWMAKAEVEPKDLLATCFSLLFLKRGTIAVVSGMPER